MHPRHYLLLLLAVQPVAALAAEPAYYGPMKAWHGIGYKFGYEDRVEKDGIWRTTTVTRGGEAVEMALYRAAEHARDMGFTYVEMHGGSASRSPGMNSATLYSRPSQSPAAPTTCRLKKRDTCYTADVGELLRRLGGPDGTQPGVAVVDHLDNFGRKVMISGYGMAAASLTPPMAVPPAPRIMTPMPVADRRPTAVAATEPSRVERILATDQPVHGRNPAQGWIISD